MDNHYLKVKDPLILKENITNLSTPINKIFNLTLLCGSVAFLITGAQSYFTPLLNENSNSTYIVFYPQGLTMSIYGIIGTILSISQILYEYNKIGEGYNEFNKRTGEIKIFRKRNLNSNVYLNYRIDDIVRNNKR